MYDIISNICTFLLYKEKTKSAYFLSTHFMCQPYREWFIDYLKLKNKKQTFFSVFIFAVRNSIEEIEYSLQRRKSSVIQLVDQYDR